MLKLNIREWYGLINHQLWIKTQWTNISTPQLNNHRFIQNLTSPKIPHGFIQEWLAGMGWQCGGEHGHVGRVDDQIVF